MTPVRLRSKVSCYDLVPASRLWKSRSSTLRRETLLERLKERVISWRGSGTGFGSFLYILFDRLRGVDWFESNFRQVFNKVTKSPCGI